MPHASVLSALFYRDSEVVLVALVKRPTTINYAEELMQWEGSHSDY
ncbi:hypothetical protein [Escherichia coli IS5]|nr:hypothetical protein [Escherichia coli IS5]